MHKPSVANDISYKIVSYLAPCTINDYDFLGKIELDIKQKGSINILLKTLTLKNFWRQFSLLEVEVCVIAFIYYNNTLHVIHQNGKF